MRLKRRAEAVWDQWPFGISAAAHDLGQIFGRQRLSDGTGRLWCMMGFMAGVLVTAY